MKNMINTEIIEVCDYSNHNCFEKALELVNKLIKDNDISKTDIIEYKTENYDEHVEGSTYYYYKVIISWWK